MTSYVEILIRGSLLEIVQIQGSSELAPIVFLHEGLGSVAMWRDFPAIVCAQTGRAGLVYSRRGYGQSTSNADARGAGRLKPDYMHREATQILPDLLSKLNVSKPILLGHSDGATIALLYAAAFECSACIALAPHLFVQDISLQSIRAAKQAFETGDLRRRLAKFHADVDGAFWQWNDVWLSEEFRSFNIQAQCAQITCPILAIQGFDDPYGTMAQIEALADAIVDNEKLAYSFQNMPRQLLKLEQCGHSPQRDQTALVLQNVAQFLKDV